MSEPPTEDILRQHFGDVDPELVTSIGRIAMLSALIENRVAAIAMSVDNGDQNEYLRAPLHQNLKVCHTRFPLFVATDFELETVSIAQRVLKDAAALLDERNEIIHRVWARASGEVWGGHKGVRLKGSQQSDRAAMPTPWANYSPEQLEDLAGRMSGVINDLQKVVGRITSFPRLPDPA